MDEELAVTMLATARPAIALGYADRFFIDGAWVAASSDDTIDVISSSTEESIYTVAEAREADVNRAVDAARRAFDSGSWTEMSHRARGNFLRAIGEQVRIRAADLAAVWAAEMGVTIAAAQAMSEAVGDVFDFYAGLGDTFPFIERHTPSAGNVGYLVREPVGVIGAIIPWNAPLTLLTYKVAPALIAGCTVVIKASPEAPGAALIFAEICAAAGLPPGVVNVLTADRTVSETLVRHPGVDKIAFTGSTIAGRRIASICGERIARFTLELGGKSAAVIMDDYDIDQAADAISGMASLMTGQVCSSLTRIIVSSKRHDAMVEALAAAFGRIRIGDPFDPDVQMGPLAMARQRDRVEQLIVSAKQEGARLAIGGNRPAQLNRGFYFEPTVFGNVSNDMTIAREEVFGPVLSVIPVSDDNEAIAIANDSIYGLNASVFTQDADRAYHAARKLRSGTVGQNMFRTDFSIAFGGFKQSGIGREGGVEGLLAYLEAKTVILDEVPSSLASLSP